MPGTSDKTIDPIDALKQFLDGKPVQRAYVGGVITVSRSRKHAVDRLKSAFRLSINRGKGPEHLSTDDLKLVDWDKIIDCRMPILLGGIKPDWSRNEVQDKDR